MSASPVRRVSEPRESVRVLSVCALESARNSLRSLFGHTNWKLEEASGCREAAEKIRSTPAPVVICDDELPDGDWKILLEEAEKLTPPSKLIVSSRLADERLWAEVLNLGGYDLLTRPYDRDEVFRTVFLAWQSWKQTLERARAKPPQREGRTRERHRAVGHSH